MRSHGLRLGALRVALPFLMCLVAAGAGCGDKKPKFPSCGKDDDCKEGQHCFQRTCSECSDDSHCDDHESCQMGSCVPRQGRCNSKADCKEGQICENNTCTACESDVQCGPDAHCSSGACLARGACNENEDCADDEDCIEGLCQRPGRTQGPGLSCELKSVYFGVDEYTLNQNDPAQETLIANNECLQQAEGANVFVEGHTDESGTEEYNIALSERRARTVADYLSRLGIDPARFRIVPKGEAQASATSKEERSDDRRVDFQWQ